MEKKELAIQSRIFDIVEPSKMFELINSLVEFINKKEDLVSNTDYSLSTKSSQCPKHAGVVTIRFKAETDIPLISGCYRCLECFKKKNPDVAIKVCSDPLLK